MGDQAASHKGNTSWRRVGAIRLYRDSGAFAIAQRSWTPCAKRIQVTREPIVCGLWDFPGNHIRNRPLGAQGTEWRLREDRSGGGRQNRGTERKFAPFLRNDFSAKFPLRSRWPMLYDKRSCSSALRRGVCSSKKN